jgi:7-carboxy-7-deazaguanine synthase
MIDPVLHIREFFLSLQGEGIHSGRPMHFIRTSGCNLQCVYCDTVEQGPALELSVSEILAKFKGGPSLPVYITGGEPLIQDGVNILTDKLIGIGREVHVDTTGSRDISVLPEGVHRIIDIKTPGSGAGNSFLKANLKHIAQSDEIKFVVTSKDDFLWIVGTIKKWKLTDLTGNITIQPAWGMIDLIELAELVKSCGLPVRMGIQLHKIIWGKNAKGV